MTLSLGARGPVPGHGAAARLWQGDDVFVLGRPSDARLTALLAQVHGTPLTYDLAGMTADAAAGRDDDPPPGFRAVRASRTVGSGSDDFAAACDGIRRWQLHRGQGFRVEPADAAVAPGTEVVTVVRLGGPVHVLAACRIVWTVDEDDRFGFAYGTLGVHPASGEEAFVVERAASGDVVARVVAFSRPHHPLARLGGPITRRQQAVATEGYLEALDRHVHGAT